MDKILTKRIQTQLSSYFSTITAMSKPETRCLKNMVLGILKSKSVFVNQIAASLRECLEFVKNGDTGKIGLGYNVLNINAINTYKEITPLYNKAYSYEMGALSSNNEIKKAVRAVKSHIDNKGCWVFDRGADTGILKDFFISECSKVIIRLKRNTKLSYKDKAYKVSQLVPKTPFLVTQTVTKIKKDKPILRLYELGAIPICYTVKGITYPLWLVVSRDKKHGGLCYLLVKSKLTTAIEVAKWAFEGYGLRWKIEEYHRHIKQEYKLEDVQLKTFNGLQSMLAILTVAMYIIYKKIRTLHFSLLLDAGYNYLNKQIVGELTNFIYYKISKVVSILLMPTRIRWNVSESTNAEGSPQLKFVFN